MSATGDTPVSLTGPLPRPEEAAELLAVSPRWIYEAVRSGQLPCLRLGRQLRFTQRMLEEWLAGNLRR